MEQVNLSIRAKECKCSNCSRDLSLQEIEIGYSLLCSICFDKEVSLVLAREVRTPPKLKGLGNAGKKK